MFRYTALLSAHLLHCLEMQTVSVQGCATRNLVMLHQITLNNCMLSRRLMAE